MGIKQSGHSQEIGVSLFLKMLEEKIEDLKHEQDSSQATTQQHPRINTKIDLSIAASLPDSYFLSETDKLNFYREIESLEDISDLEYLKESLLSQSEDTVIHNETENLFLLLEAQLLAQKKKITHIKRVGIHYQIDFDNSLSLDELKLFLREDSELSFQVIDIHHLRASVKGFANEQIFLQYVLRVLY